MVVEPMTRCHAGEGNIPLAVTYYTRRVSAGLIVTEGSQVSPKGVGFDRTPGIYSPELVAGSIKITRAV
jgi:N-ethylmaleimide reductase